MNFWEWNETEQNEFLMYLDKKELGGLYFKVRFLQNGTERIEI